MKDLITLYDHYQAQMKSLEEKHNDDIDNIVYGLVDPAKTDWNSQDIRNYMYYLTRSEKLHEAILILKQEKQLGEVEF